MGTLPSHPNHDYSTSPAIIDSTSNLGRPMRGPGLSMGAIRRPPVEPMATGPSSVHRHSLAGIGRRHSRMRDNSTRTGRELACLLVLSQLASPPMRTTMLLAALLIMATAGCKRPGQPHVSLVPTPGSPADTAHIPHIVRGFRAEMPIRHVQIKPIGGIPPLGEPFPIP